MASLFDQLSRHVNADTVSKIADQIGATPGQTQEAVAAAMPMLLGALARNSATPQGADGILGALGRDHDGSLLDNLGGLLGGLGGGSGPGSGGLGDIGGILGGMLGGGSPSAGQAGGGGGGGGMMDIGGAILGHVFGGKQGNVASTLGKSTGMKSGQILQLLAMLAPIVMAVLGKQNKQSGGLDQGGLADILGGAFQQSAAKAPPSVTQSAGAGGIGGLLSSILDRDKDGSVMDDLMEQGGGILGSLLGGPKKS